MGEIKKTNFILTIFYLLLFGGIIWFYQNNRHFQEITNVSIHNVQVLTQNVFRRLTGKELSTPANDASDQSNTENVPQNARWQQNSATVYVDTDNPVLRNAAERAIKQWNQTKVFTFRPTTSKKDANITITAVNEDNNGAAGLTNVSMNSITGYYLHATVYLNSYYLLNPTFGYSQQRIINTAEHELGHAIGLQHTNQRSVMQPAGSYNSIQPLDIANVRKLYRQTPQPSPDTAS